MKFTFYLFLLFLSCTLIKSQNYSINETIQYINTLSNKKVSVSGDGKMTFTYPNRSEVEEMYINDVEVDNSYVSEFFRIRCKKTQGSIVKFAPKCIQERSNYANKNSDYILIGGSDYNATKKLLNAYSYLFKKLDEQGYNNQSDPFAPNNNSYSEKEPTLNTNNETLQLEDVGFNPFIGKTSKSANFRTEPYTNSDIITKISTGLPIYIISDKTKNDFYKAIDINTGKIGWISKSLVKWHTKVETNSDSGFYSTGKTTTFESEVTITNKSTSKITLIVGQESIYINPLSTISKLISPGKKYYIATAPGVIPSSGYYEFGSYEGYKWEFWIETRRR